METLTKSSHSTTSHGLPMPLVDNESGTRSAVTIFVRDLIVKTTIGVYPEERLHPRTLQMDLEIETFSANKSGLTDQLADTIDYGAVVNRIRESIADESFFLLERVAECVASLILVEFRAQRVRVGLFKTGVLESVGSVGVRIERTYPRVVAPQSRLQLEGEAA